MLEKHSDGFSCYENWMIWELFVLLMQEKPLDQCWMWLEWNSLATLSILIAIWLLNWSCLDLIGIIICFDYLLEFLIGSNVITSKYSPLYLWACIKLSIVMSWKLSTPSNWFMHNDSSYCPIFWLRETVDFIHMWLMIMIMVWVSI